MQSRNDKDMIGDMAEQTRFFRTCVGVFQGGGCRGAALAGAYQEAVARGVTFAEVAGTSAGSIVAALIGAGARGLA
jgi:predicted acylesterase/phospholipase RssA